jgi:hypothetical protein
VNGWNERDDDTDALVDAWLEGADAADHAHAVERFARHAPELGWRCILAILELPDAFAWRSRIAHDLQVLISRHGEQLIDRIEAEAEASPAFRGCLAEMRNEPPFTVAEPLWPRLSAAAGKPFGEMSARMARLHAEMPQMAELLAWDPHPFAPEDAPELDEDAVRAIATDWLRYQQCFWACDELGRLRDEPEALWPVLLRIVERGSARALGSLGAGALEDLVREHGAEMIERIEARAADDARFRFCLSHVWPGDVAPEIWDRVVAARGEEPARG